MDYKTYGKEFQKRPSHCRLMQPFVFATDFRADKRFARYVTKVRNICDRAAKEYFDLSSVYENDDATQLILHEIKSEAVKRYMTKMAEDKDEADDEDDVGEFGEEAENKMLDELLSPDSVDNLDNEGKGEAECDDEDESENTDFDFFEDVLYDDGEYETMRFLIKKQSELLGVEDDFDVLEEIDDNFCHLHDYQFEDVNMPKMWNDILMIFFEYELLMKVKSGEVVDENSVRHALKEENAIVGNYNTILTVVNHEFEECCFDYLRYRIAEENSTVNYDNFTIHAMPRGDGEALWIISNVIDRAALNMLNRVRDENAIDTSERSAVETYKRERNEAIEEREEVEEELEKERDKSFALRKKLEGFEKIKEKEFADLKAENQDLYYEKAKLEKKNLSLESECARLKKMIAEMQSDMRDEEEEVARSDEKSVEVDATKKYIFVMDGYPFGEEQILKAFPNSKIVDDYVEFNPSTVDAVVCITSRVKHYVYYSTKDYCKKKGVPFIHSTRANPEMIKRAIAECEK